MLGDLIVSGGSVTVDDRVVHRTWDGRGKMGAPPDLALYITLYLDINDSTYLYSTLRVADSSQTVDC